MAYAYSRPSIRSDMRTMPAGFYTDPAWHKRELEAIHFDMWLYAGRAEAASRPGDFFLVEAGNASLIILRDEEGKLRALNNVCRHRGTRLCTGPSGSLIAGRIRCHYHAWAYRLDGTLAHAPFMDKVEGFREEDFPLGRAHVAEWAGHVFVCLAPRPIPFAAHLDGLDERFRPWRMEDMRVVERRSYELRANWKLIVSNYHECLHCPVVHPQLNRQSHFLSGENEAPRATWLGARMDLRDEFPTLSLLDDPGRPPIAALDAVQRRSVYYYALLPNLLLNLHPDYVVTFRFNPRSVDRTEIVCEWLFPRETIARPGFDPADAVGFWDMTNRQDWMLSDLAQAGIASRGYAPGPYSNREELLLAFDRWVLERLDLGHV